MTKDLFHDIDFEIVLQWLDKLGTFAKQEMLGFSCFLHTDAAYPQNESLEGVEEISRGRSAFFVFGNKNQFYEISDFEKLKEAAFELGAYGFVKIYFCKSRDTDSLRKAIKGKRIGFYRDTRNQESPFLEGLFDEFIEVETWTECTSAANGKEMTYLKVFNSSTVALPSVPV